MRCGQRIKIIIFGFVNKNPQVMDFVNYWNYVWKILVCRQLAIESWIHTKQKHKIKLKEGMQGLYFFFKQTASDEPSTPTSSSHENSSWSKTVTNYFDELLYISYRLLNAEIYWLQVVVKENFCYRSCADIAVRLKLCLEKMSK